MSRDLAHVLDATLVALVALLVAVGVGVFAGRPGVALALALPAAGVLAFRRVAPTSTLLVSGGLVLGLSAIDHHAGAIAAIAPAAALYSFALTRGRLHLLVAVLGVVAAVVIADTLLAPHGSHLFALQTAGHVALVAVPVLAAEALRNRRGYIALLRERLEESERSREAEAQHRVEQERLRIARDLHDVIAHTLSTINVQAGVAAHLLDSEPTPARTALTTIEAASHEALDELRTIVGVLRSDGKGEALPLQPAPGLDDIDDLVLQSRAGGGEVAVATRGERPEHVAEAVQLAAYRILQESLTNVRRHAPRAAARVELTYGVDRLELTVVNELSAGEVSSPRGAGVGITGMRERAAALGGTVDVNAAGRSFVVSASLPYRRSS